MGSSNSNLKASHEDELKQEAGMGSLPVELIEKVAEYLTPQELAACCAVSVGWREVYNQDSLWKRHCDKVTAEYLETAECRVEPGFESPESEDSTLSPVCRWRMCYMRENHLHNNWRQWKYVRDEIRTEGNVQVALYAFVSHDALITSSGLKFMLWDVKNAPLLLGNPFCALFNDIGYVFEMINDNTVVVVKTYTVELYRFESMSDKTWPLEYFFFIDGTETHSPSETQELIETKQEHGRIFNVYLVTNGYFVGFTTKHSYVLHIWDLHKGEKLRRVECPVILNGRDTYCSLVTSEKQSMDFVVFVRYAQNNGYKFNFYVYSLSKLEFLPFEVSHDFSKRDMKCVLHDQFLVISDDRFINVYNYLASTLIVTVPTTGCDILAVGCNILIMEKHKLQAMFNTQTLRIEPLTVTNSNKVPLISALGRSMSDKFFYTIDDRVEVQIWEIGRSSLSGNVKWINSFKHLESYKICKSATKLIFISSFYGDKFNVVSFW